MRFIVCKKGFRSIFPVTLLYNCIAVIGIVITAMDQQRESKYVLIILSIVLIAINSWFYFQCRYLLAVIVLKEEEMVCRFLNAVRKRIRYNEVKEYGEYFDRGIKMIYVSTFPLTERQREQQLFRLFKKSQGVIVFQYQEQAMAVLREKVNGEPIQL